VRNPWLQFFYLISEIIVSIGVEQPLGLDITRAAPLPGVCRPKTD
jgi:hypothetical protein